MKQALHISIGQCSSKGRKKINQDFVGACLPKEPLLSTKGAAIAVADGISSSDVSQVASETAVSSFLQDYFCTSEAWSVKKSAECVLAATNSWLYSQTRNGPYRYNKEKGYICTFSALILKGQAAHLFHSGDTRIYRFVGGQLEQLTDDHRRYVDSENSYLTRALGIDESLSLDYRSVPVEQGDIFILASDGVYEFITAPQVNAALNMHSDALNDAARCLVDEAYRAGSSDNLSLQIVRVEQLPDSQIDEIYHQVSSLPLPPKLQARMQFDGYDIEREIYISSRSHVFLARDSHTQTKVVIKTPSTEMRGDRLYLERFLMEDWIARRIDNPHVLRAINSEKKRHYLYLVSEYVEGQTLKQWMHDNPFPSVQIVRELVNQIAKGLQAFHRQEMVHQDLRPANVLIDNNGTVKIIDFGSTKVAGVAEIKYSDDIQGTAQYTAPEYFLGEEGSARSDLFSLGVMCYQMLSGKLPYGTAVASSRSTSAQRRLVYQPLTQLRKDIPVWLDLAIKKALSVQPHKRYPVLSEFLYDLHNPNKAFLNQARPPLLERNPVMFWQGVCAVLLFIIIGLLATG
ncbi:serine/threonine protein kinase [Alteromonadaceae bacterium 2753L.S.0a.02]|nr:serine/threonine protein kinase [Alteromonadaceae bacterium 2753L.S.0a.02]